MKSWLTVVAAAAVLANFANAALAQPGESLPVPGVNAARDVPGAHLVPDPNKTYKVVFDLRAAPPAVGDVNPGLVAIARYVNTLVKYGVPTEKRRIAAVIHRDATEMIVDNATFMKRNEGQDNPNIAMIRQLDAAGVEFHVCGQAVLGRQIEPETIMPEIELDLWALTTFIELQLDGYVRIGG
jgi:intracellular sulfur oxidation DsrE/DsrF family protein